MEREKEIDMRKLGLALLGIIVLILLFTIGSASENGGDIGQILLPALAAIVVIVSAITIAPWLYEKIVNSSLVIEWLPNAKKGSM